MGEGSCVALAVGWEGPCWRALLLGRISCQQGHGQLLPLQLSARGWELLWAPHPQLLHLLSRASSQERHQGQENTAQAGAELQLLQVLSVGGTFKGLQRASCRPVVLITG